MRFVVTGQLLDPSGYGEFGRLILWALSRQGHEVFARCMNVRPEHPSRFGHKGELVKELLREPTGHIDAALIVYVPSTLRRLKEPETLNLSVTMHETDHIPEVYAHALGEVDAVLVPSAWNERAFEAAGVKRVSVLHPPLDRGLAIELAPRSGPFDFVSIFEWSTDAHKNPIALIKAFCLAFSALDPVRLVIKTGGDEARIRRDVDEVLEHFRMPPEIRIHVGSMTRDETTALLERSSCYVSSHRAEGWGLPLFEAMGMGLPAIATRFSAPLEFMDSESSYLVGYEYDCDLGHAEISIGDLAAAMLHVFEHQDEARDRAMEAQSKIVQRFTPAHTAEQIVNAVKALAPKHTAEPLSPAVV